MRRIATSLALLVVSTAAGCEYSAGLAPAARARIAVHAVLNAGAGSQVVLVERTLVDGRHCTPAFGDPGAGPLVGDCEVDPDDPIVAAGGEPISGAEVVVYGAAGDSAVAVEDLARRGDGKGAGVYRFANGAIDPSRPLGERASLDIVPGQRYRLRVTTPLGTATAQTTLPNGPIVTSAPTLQFNVERGEIQKRQAVAVEGAAGYLAALDAPLGRVLRLFDHPVALLAFSDALIAGDLNSTKPGARYQESLVPGLVSEGRVSALDTNYVRSLRAGSGEDPFSSENPGNSIENGVGLFGSMVPVSLLRLDVISFVDEPIEGRYVLVDGPPAAPTELQIFSYHGVLSGSFEPSDHATSAMLGIGNTGPSLQLVFYTRRLTGDMLGRFEGHYSAGELVGVFTAHDAAGVDARYRRTP